MLIFLFLSDSKYLVSLEHKTLSAKAASHISVQYLISDVPALVGSVTQSFKINNHIPGPISALHILYIL